MLVETYEVPEVDALCTVECDAAAIALIDQLGLEGQQSLVKTDDDFDIKSRVPYRKMTAEEKFVYTHILPRREELKKYKDAPIPLRVLQVAAHVNELKLYKSLQVWCPENADAPDPILVGYNGTSYAPSELFMLARWGEVLEPFGSLIVKACKIARGSFLADLEEIIGKVRARIDALNAINDEALSAGKFKMPSFYH